MRTAAGAQAILHCGDIVAPTTLRVLKKFNLPVHAIHGNNMGDMYVMHQLVHEPDSPVRYHGQDAVVQPRPVGRIFMVHYPHYAQGMALTGDYDIVCCGHDHRVSVKPVANVKGGTTWLINPGTVGGVGKGPTYILADLDALTSISTTCPPNRARHATSGPPAYIHKSNKNKTLGLCPI
jgi:predicted phosphodiesterase